MAKISIYVPDDMKARIDKFEDTNWSGIAQGAFNIRLDQLEAVKEIGEMSDVIERLRASKTEFVQTSLSYGTSDGANWAKREASYALLRSMAMVDDSVLEQQNDGQSAATLVYHRIHRGEVENPHAYEISVLFGIAEEVAPLITPEYVIGFVQGAREVWEEVADKI